MCVHVSHCCCELHSKSKFFSSMVLWFLSGVPKVLLQLNQKKSSIKKEELKNNNV